MAKSEDERKESMGGYSEALSWVRECMSGILKHNSIDDLKDMSAAAFVIDFHPEIRSHKRGGPETQAYEVTDRLALSIGVLSRRDKTFHEIASMICAANVFNGVPVPHQLRPFAQLKMIGELSEPRSRGPKPGKGFVIKLLLRDFAVFVASMFDVNLTRYDSKAAEDSACDIVIKVAAENGYHVSYNTLRDWCQNSKYQAFREQADNLTDLFKDFYLIQVGALRPRV